MMDKKPGLARPLGLMFFNSHLNICIFYTEFTLHIAGLNLLNKWLSKSIWVH